MTLPADILPPAPVPTSGGVIALRGVRHHNLRGFDLDIPWGRLTVITGVSGSGKSTLAFDTLYAEGQRRYVECLSSYARQFVERMDRPQVDDIRGILPAVALRQGKAIRAARATVGSLTECGELFRAMFAHGAQPDCPRCGAAVRRASVSQLAAEALAHAAGRRAVVTFDLPVASVVAARAAAQGLAEAGYHRAWQDGAVADLAAVLAKEQVGDVVEVLQDRLVLEQDEHGRLVDSLQQALRRGGGVVSLHVQGDAVTAGPVQWQVPAETVHGFARWRASSTLRCTVCAESVPEPSPQLFSASSAIGACPACNGFGRMADIDLHRVIPDGRKTLRNGAIKPWSTEATTDERRDLAAFCDRRGIDLDTPWQELSEADQQAVVGGEKGKGAGKFYGIRGWFTWLETKTYKMHVRVLLARYRAYLPCKSCGGQRLRPEALAWKLAGRSLPQWLALPVEQVDAGLQTLPLSETEALALAQPLRDLQRRVSFLSEVGLPYLTLDRAARTLSGGELQRVQLVAALATGLSQVLYVLDEPSVGLHPRDNDRLLRILERLKLAGNTVVVVEHDPALILAADVVVDLGPGAGEHGGELLYAGPASGLHDQPRSLTAAYLSGALVVDTPVPEPIAPRLLKRKSAMTSEELVICGATARNLRGTDVTLRKGHINVVCGVSGSGKSTLIEEVLYRQLLRARGEAVDEPGACASITGGSDFTDVILVDQELPQGSNRANCATYLKVWDAIRARLAEEPLAGSRGYTAATFSFNREGGRCAVCEGLGVLTVEMQFLSDVRMVCEACGGKRFRADVLQVRHRGLDAAGFLERTAAEIAEQFGDDPGLSQPMAALVSLGLGYLRLGQPLATLSGGESQRLKIAWHLLQARTQNALFLLDEPSTGLHLHDVAVLLRNLRQLQDRGNTIVLVEHHLDLIAAADHVVELGPEGGPDGGHILYQGPAAGLLERDTPTARFLRQHKLGGVYQRTPGLQDADDSVDRDPGVIQVRGARVHNLRNVSLDVPRTGMTVVTGLSGSGKSSLAFDVLFAEGQRRFLDCLSPFARQYLPPATRPDVDLLAGLPPTVAIAQRTTRGGLRSTVGTLTDIYPYLRLLWARCGEQRCPTCGGAVSSQNPEDIATALATRYQTAKAVYVLAPAIRGRKGHHKEVLDRAAQLGHDWVQVDGSLVPLLALPPLRRYAAHDLDYVVARLHGPDTSADQWLDAVDRALTLGDGTVLARTSDQPAQTFSLRRHCTTCDVSVEAPDPRLFTFTSSVGWCQTCEGTGVLAANSTAVATVDTEVDGEAPAKKRGRPKTTKDKAKDKAKTTDGRSTEELQKAGLPDGGEDVPEEALRRLQPCPACHGSRLRPEASSVRLGGRTLPEAVGTGPGGLGDWLQGQQWPRRIQPVAEPIVREVVARCRFLSRMGLDYLPLARGAATLSGGESQRLRLAAQLASNLTGVLYVLDEPTIGLHPQDNTRVLDALQQLADRGNGLLVVEHDEETIARADHILELGPGGGRDGGQLVFAGSVAELHHANTATGHCLRHPHLRLVRPAPRPVPDVLPGSDLPHITLHGARRNNLRNVTVHIPRGRLTAVSGVSGSGKSTLIRDLLVVYGNQGVSVTDRRLGPQFAGNQELQALTGLEDVGRVVEVDQSPIGRTPRSTPATYMGIFDPIRQVFAALPDAKVAGLSASAFSFNAEGGRCSACGGAGTLKVAMSFLPTAFVPCEACGGTRYAAHALQVRYKGASIADVLQMSMQEAVEHFAAIQSIARPLTLACKMGLTYLQLGQGSHTLSGGEAQRLKIITELSKTRRKETLYVLDEPSTGLHLQDVAKLLAVLHELVDRGDTVVVIEHQLDLLAQADWLIDLGPGAGEAGGQVLWQGPVAGLLAGGSGATRNAMLAAQFPTEQNPPKPPKAGRKTKP